MKRTFLVVLVLALASVAAGATYKIQLGTGKIIVVDAAPVVKDGLAYFTKNGMTFYMPASQIDEAKTQDLNKEQTAAPETAAEVTAPAESKVPVIDEEQLDIIRKRSRLANEGQLVSPMPGEAGPAVSAPPATGGGGQTGNSDALRAQLADLLNRRGSLMQQQTNIQSQIAALRDKYNFSTQQTDQAAIQAQMDSLSSQLDSVRQQIDAVNNQALSVQQSLASTTRGVTVQMPSQEPPPPPPPQAPMN